MLDSFVVEIAKTTTGDGAAPGEMKIHRARASVAEEENPPSRRIAVPPLSPRLELVLSKLPRRRLWLISDQNGAPIV
jgi:hypothetical protein